MFDAVPPVPVMQRMQGAADVALSLRGGRVRLDRLYQRGSAKAMLPSVHSAVPEVVFLNTAGGLTGGDRLAYALDVGAGAAAVATTQTAERVYASLGGASSGGQAEVSVTLSIGAGARLDWLPQETILFDHASLARRTCVSMATDARLVMVETVVLGRAAMGEVIRDLSFTDWREVRRGGALALVEPLRLTPASLAASPALLGGARAFASLWLVAQGAEDALKPVRAALPEDVEAAASAWDGKCVVRLRAADGWPLRRAIKQILGVMRGTDLPRTWQI
ncbi:urease accessory protein [Rhodobacteraceae bacterium MBR-64]